MRNCCKAFAGVISDKNKIYNYFFTFWVVNYSTYSSRFLILYI